MVPIWPSVIVTGVLGKSRIRGETGCVPELLPLDEVEPLLVEDDELDDVDEPELLLDELELVEDPVDPELTPVLPSLNLLSVGAVLPPPPPPQADNDNIAAETSNLAAVSLNEKLLGLFALLMSVFIDLPQIIRTCFPCISLNAFVFGDLDINAIHMPLQINPKNQTVIFFIEIDSVNL